MNNTDISANIIKKKSKKKYYLIAAFVISVLLVVSLISLPNRNVIGMEIIHDGAATSEIRIKYFNDSDIAEKYFIDNNIQKYYIFIRSDKPETEEWYKQLDYSIHDDGFKHVVFIAEGNTLASDLALDFINKNGLQKVKSYSDK